MYTDENRGGGNRRRLTRLDIHDDTDETDYRWGKSKAG